jgi:hypothetical protein
VGSDDRRASRQFSAVVSSQLCEIPGGDGVGISKMGVRSVVLSKGRRGKEDEGRDEGRDSRFTVR